MTWKPNYAAYDTATLIDLRIHAVKEQFRFRDWRFGNCAEPNELIRWTDKIHRIDKEIQHRKEVFKW